MTPKISVRQDSDGLYYWIVNGEWLLVDGKKVRADGYDGLNGKDGQDAITPQFKIEDGYVIFVMNDPDLTTLKIPMAGTYYVSSIKYVPESLDRVVKMKYFTDCDKFLVEDVMVKFEILPHRKTTCLKLAVGTPNVLLVYEEGAESEK